MGPGGVGAAATASSPRAARAQAGKLSRGRAPGGVTRVNYLSKLEQLSEKEETTCNVKGGFVTNLQVGATVLRGQTRMAAATRLRPAVPTPASLPIKLFRLGGEPGGAAAHQQRQPLRPGVSTPRPRQSVQRDGAAGAACELSTGGNHPPGRLDGRTPCQYFHH